MKKRRKSEQWSHKWRITWMTGGASGPVKMNARQKGKEGRELRKNGLANGRTDAKDRGKMERKREEERGKSRKRDVVATGSENEIKADLWARKQWFYGLRMAHRHKHLPAHTLHTFLFIHSQIFLTDFHGTEKDHRRTPSSGQSFQSVRARECGRKIE